MSDETGGDAATTQPTDGGTPSTTSTVTALEDWYADQSDEVKGLINANLGAMRNALSAIKDERDSLRATLKTKDLDAAAKVDAIEAQLEAAEQKAAFFSSLPSTCVDRDLAFLAAQKSNLLNRDGSVKADLLQQKHPGLFSSPPQPTGNAGVATGGTPPVNEPYDMNAMIREQARGGPLRFSTRR